MYSEVVPFGKYKGQPVEELAQDRQYVDWLLGQDWFAAKFQSLYTVIVNNFQEPSETPEHNAMQAKFLDDAYCKQLCGFPMRIGPVSGWVKTRQKQARFESVDFGVADPIVRDRVFEKNAIDVAYRLHWNGPRVRMVDSAGIPFAVSGYEARYEISLVFDATSEKYSSLVRPDIDLDSSGNIPVILAGGLWVDATVELKPSIGDDFPAILRKMSLTKGSTRILLTQAYNGRGATLAQVKAMFRASGIRLIVESEISVNGTVERQSSAAPGEAQR